MTWTRSSSLFLLALVLPCGKAIAAGAGSIRCPAGESYVYLYQTADNFQVVANLKCGLKVQILDAQTSLMVRVRTSDGKEGYVSKSDLTAITSATQQPDATSPATNSSSPAAPQISTPVPTTPQGAAQQPPSGQPATPEPQHVRRLEGLMQFPHKLRNR